MYIIKSITLQCGYSNYATYQWNLYYTIFFARLPIFWTMVNIHWPLYNISNHTYKKLGLNFSKLCPDTIWPLRFYILALKIYPVVPKPYHVAPKIWLAPKNLVPINPRVNFSTDITSLWLKIVEYLFETRGWHCIWNTKEYRGNKVKDQAAQNNKPQQQPGHQQDTLPGTQAMHSKTR